MTKSRRYLVAAAITAVAVIATTTGASAAITWPASDTRTKEQPRTWNASVVADRISGSHYPGTNAVAVSNNGATEYIHAVQSTDGAGGALDINNLPSRPASYPYFGGQVAYGGNGAPTTNLNAATPYWDGDCGVMRPHLLTDDFGKYLGAWQPETLTGGTATLAAGGVLTLTDDQIANFDKLEVGDRIQTTNFVPAVFNRRATGAGPTAGNVDPITNAPYWRVTSTPAWNQVVAVPDAPTARATVSATWGAGTATFNSARGGDLMFQGMKVGQRVTISGMTPSGYNGTFIVTGAPSLTPSRFTVAIPVNPGASPATGQGTVTLDTDAIFTHAITAASAVGTTATYTVPTGHGMIAGQTVIVSGMSPVAYDNAGNPITITGVTATTITGTVAVAPAGAATVFGEAQVNTSTATTMGQLMRGSDCSRVIYERSTDNGVTWDGGGSGVASPCAAGVNCGSVHAFNVAGGGTNGGVKSYLSEMHTSGAQVETYNQYVYVVFHSTNGGENTYWQDLCPNDPKVAYIRVNNNYGAWNAWSAPLRITPAAGQTMYPVLSVDKANGNLYILSVDANDGRLMVYKSTNNGTSFDAGTHVEHTNVKGYTEFIPPTDPATANPTTPCVNSARTIPDDTGYGGVYYPTARIAAHNNNIGVAWIKNAAGNKIVAAVSDNGGTSYTSNQHLASVGGAGGLCPGYGCYIGGPATCPYDYTVCNDDTLDYDLSVVAGPAAAGSRIGFAWVEDGGLTKSAAGPQRATRSRGLYYKQWNSSTGSWSVDRLVSCMQGTPYGPARNGTLSNYVTVASGNIAGMTTTMTLVTSAAHGLAVGERFRVNGVVSSNAANPGGFNNDWVVSTVPNATTITVVGGAVPGVSANVVTGTSTGWVGRYSASGADPCNGAAAATAQMDFAHPSLALWGTSGVGVVYMGCPVGPVKPCAGDATDPGSQILYKESGNSGTGWGADWSTTGGGGNGGAYKQVATVPLAAQSYGDADMWRSSYGPDLEYEDPGDSASGCTQQASGAPNVGCNRFVFFVGYSSGANPAYNYSYVQFLMRGVQT